MKALLLQLDGRIPNIALMRLSAHLRDRGVDVELRIARNAGAIERGLWDSFDEVYASLIFESTRPVAMRLREIRPDVVLGGTGWDLTTTLEGIGVETREQDYTLYPAFAPSIGFTQRGCRLRCEFCVVPRKEGAVREEQTIAELWRGGDHPRDLLLLDNDFFGQERWRERIAEMNDHGPPNAKGVRPGPFRVSFNQGINARFLNEETAAAVASVDYRDDSMRDRRLYTAWDSRKDERRLFAGLELLVANGVKPRHLMVYMLIGYWPGETHEDRDHRRRRLRDFGALPYPMPFHRTSELVGFQRWVIKGYDKWISWKDWSAAHYQPRGLIRPGSLEPRLPGLD